MSGRFITPFLAFCPECKQQVTATPLFTRLEAKEALSSGADLYVIHFADREHRFALDQHERENLRRTMKADKV